jgi:hypothetical protein
MMDKEDFKDVRVEKYGHHVSNETFIFSKYLKPPRHFLAIKGGYNVAFNNCQHFVRRFFYQVSIPREARDFLRLPFIAKDLWFSGMSESNLREILHNIKSGDQTVSGNYLGIAHANNSIVFFKKKLELFLKHFLERGADAVMLDLSTGAAEAVDASQSTKEMAISLSKKAQNIVDVIEKANQAVNSAAERAPPTKDAPEADSSRETFNVEKLEKATKTAVEELKALEQLMEGFLENVLETAAKVRGVRKLVEKNLKTVETAESMWR